MENWALPDNPIYVDGHSASVSWWISAGPPCGVKVTQFLSFMTNPFTNREDMVRIKYTALEAGDTPIIYCDGRIKFTQRHVGIRLMLDTMIGDNDNAPFFIPGVGMTNTVQTFDGDTIPPFFRVFEADDYAPESLQAIGLLNLHESENAYAPDRFLVTSWPDIYIDGVLPLTEFAAYWDYTAVPDTPNGDSAIAIYWDDQTKNSYPTGGSWQGSWEIGYGLAPLGGGGSWADTPAKMEGNTTDCWFWVTNSSDKPYTGGVATLTLPPGLTIAGATKAASLTNSQRFTQTIADVAPGAAAQVGWHIQATGGPGVYQFSTQAMFASGQTFSNTHTVTVQETVGFAQDHYAVNENAGTATITLTRHNPSSHPFTVDYATSDGTAIAGHDYVAITGTLTFAGDELTKTLTIPLIDNPIYEGNKTLLLALSAPTADVEVLEQNQVSLTINDDEPTVVNQPLSINVIGEGSVTLDPPGGLYAQGKMVTLTAVPTTNATFIGWSGAVTATVNPLMITMDSAQAITATFTQTLSSNERIYLPTIQR